MPRLDYKRCKVCGGHSDQVGVLSHERLCSTCGPRRQLEQNTQMHHHVGPWFHDWRRRMAASVGGVLLDDTPLDP